MTLLIILLCLGLNAFTPVGRWARQYNWLSHYFTYHQKWLGTTPFGKGVLGLALMPAVIVVAILQWIMFYFTWGIADFIFGALILLYALGVMPQTEKSSQKKTKVATSQTIEEAARGQSVVLSSENSAGILWQAQTNIFAVLFWFVILGPAGAVLYRFSRLLSEQTYVEDSPQIRQSAERWISYLDWLPVRLLGICLVLAGRFESAFKVWWGQIGKSPKDNAAYLEACGHAALEHGQDNPSTQWSLFQRALSILLVVLVLIALTARMHS